MAGGPADIAVLEVAPNDSHSAALAATRADARYRAVVVITSGGLPGLAPLNAVDLAGKKPSGPPVVQVSSEERPWLHAAAAAQNIGTVNAQLQRADARARNVVAILPGSDANLAPIVIHVGASGWGPCVGERGGALMCWVTGVQFMIENRPARATVFVAASGDELGHLGIKAFEKRHPELVTHAYGWLNLGANLGAHASPLRVTGTQADWQRMALARLKIESAKLDSSLDDAARLSIDGTVGPSTVPHLAFSAPPSAAFHLPQDRLPDAVDIRQVLAISRGFGRTVLELAKT